ncbi:hypothetical protein ACWDRB_62575 [Nonomuraea sp. NPDC003707]
MASTSALLQPGRDPIDIAADACARVATHLDLLTHRLGEASLSEGERERLAAALKTVEQAVARTAADVGLWCGGAGLGPGAGARPCGGGAGCGAAGPAHIEPPVPAGGDPL